MKCTNQKLNPNWITGFTDGDGSFTLDHTKKRGLVSCTFSIMQSLPNYDLLVKIKDYFGCGTINKNVRSKSLHNTNIPAYKYRVSRQADIENIIIPHFHDFPLQTRKQKDFVKWKKAFYLKFRQTLPPKVKYRKNTILNPNWITGFTEAEGSFYISFEPRNSIRTVLDIGQTAELSLLKKIQRSLKCGRIYNQNDHSKLQVVPYLKHLKYIIPFFTEYKLHGRMLSTFTIFKQVVIFREQRLRKRGQTTTAALNEVKQLQKSMYDFPLCKEMLEKWNLRVLPNNLVSKDLLEIRFKTESNE